MRQIKFRAWDGKEMRTSFVIHNESGVSMIENRYEGGWILKPQDWKVMQFSGLLDKNGKKIYEGDVLRESDNELVFEVKWHEEYGGYVMPKKYDPEYICMIGGIPTHIEIIGNIYENPELLKS